jgi:cytoskeleton protein RodZ
MMTAISTGFPQNAMSQEPQSPRWPEAEVKTIPKRIPEQGSAPDVAREPDFGNKRAGSFGERLQRERELRAISLDEIANSTKIGTRLLHALEAEEFDKLPGGIFNKGFVRAYAKYLGLDEEQAVTDYMAAESEKERMRRSPSASEENRNSSQPQLFSIKGGSRPDNVYNIRASADVVEQQPAQAQGFLMAAVILVFVLGIGGFGWKYYSSHSAANNATSAGDQPAQVASPALQTPSPAQVQSQPVPAATDSTTLTSTPSLNSMAPTTPALSPSPEPPSDANKTVAASDKPANISPGGKSQSPDSPAASALVPGSFTLDLRADEQSWVQISSDGKVLWSGIVNKDASKSFRASKELIVKLGNAPGIELSYNGKTLPRFTQDAKTRTLTFTPEGLSPR